MPQPVTHLNTDFTQRVVTHALDANWSPSALVGVERRMLDRIGAEMGRATSIVRYAPGAAFHPHTHAGGEEILVLEGIFSDEHGDYPADTYLRNPPGTTHQPHSLNGCMIFVKLWQFAADDSQAVHCNTRLAEWHPGLVPGLSVLPLHDHDGVNTALVRWAPHSRFNAHVHPGGEEILVLEGVFRDEDGVYPKGSWLRNPCGSHHAPYTGEEGALIYVKLGHLGATFLTPSQP